VEGGDRALDDAQLRTLEERLRCLRELDERRAAILGCKVLNLPGNDVSTYLDGMKARAGRAHARLKSIGVPTP